MNKFYSKCGILYSFVWAMIVTMALSVQAQTKPAAPAWSNQPPGSATTGQQPQDPVKRAEELIRKIEYQPTGIYVNRNANPIADPNRQAYNPDGTRNQNFKVEADYTAPEISKIFNVEQHRMQYAAELIKIGKPAVPALMLAACNEGYKYRHYYCHCLAAIGDLRASAALLKYYTDGIRQVKLAESIRTTGDQTWAAEVEKQGNQMKQLAIASLKQLSGQTIGDDFTAWETWWNQKKPELGPIPPLTTYTANPTAPAATGYSTNIGTIP